MTKPRGIFRRQCKVIGITEYIH